jgi:hypothetical protein
MALGTQTLHEKSKNPKQQPKDDSSKSEEDESTEESVSFAEGSTTKGKSEDTRKDALGDPRHLQNAITMASQQANASRSKRDPPTRRPGRGYRDPPSEQCSTFKIEGGPDPTASSPMLNTSRHVSPLKTAQENLHEPSYREPAASPAVRNLRVSPRVKKLEEACEGFDRIQEKIARLRMLLSSNDVVSKQPQAAVSAEEHLRRRMRSKGPNVETLDSAFTKLNQIQSKMRALQALVKSNQLR